MDRRDFLKAGLVLGGAAALGGCRVFAVDPRPSAGRHSVLDGPPGDSGIDTIVICMMENRSFDSYLGWLARDESYLHHGRRIYGSNFAVNGNSFQSFPGPGGTRVDTYRRVRYPDADPWRACGHPDPSHSWNGGRAERDGGFLAPGSGNDIFALGYFEAEDLPVYQRLARRFIVCDDWHASLLGPTYPNREYLMSGQSGGNMTNAFPTTPAGFAWDNILLKLARAGVSGAEYYGDLPMFALFGPQMNPFEHPVANFHDDAARGRLPKVSFITPSFLGDETRTDDHPHGDPRAAQRFVGDVFESFVKSPHWHNGLFVLTYDEWGGFFDHVVPPHFADDRASTNDAIDFSQAGFRVPTILASPRGLPSAVDHWQYDHTSILRFLEWRFLGAPPRGAGGATSWSLTTRDRNARNAGEMLSSQYFDPELYFLPHISVPLPSRACTTTVQGLAAPSGGDEEESPWIVGLENGYWDRVGVKVLAS